MSLPEGPRGETNDKQVPPGDESTKIRKDQIEQPEAATPGEGEVAESTFNLLAVLISAGVAELLTFAAVASGIGRPWFTVFVVVFVLTGLALEVIDQDFKTTRVNASTRPSVPEFALAAGYSLQIQATWALLTLAAYYVLWWTIRGVNAILDVSWDPSDIAFVLTMIVSASFISLCAMAGSLDIATSLYPQTVGIQSGFYELAKNRRGLVLCVGTLTLFLMVLFSAFTFATARGSGWISAGFIFGLLVLSSFVEPEPHEPIEDHPPEPTLEALLRAFETSDYDTAPFPRTRRADTDPLLLDVDVLADKGEEAVEGLAVDLKQRLGDEVDWIVGSALVTASRALERAVDGYEHVQPVLILVDASADVSLRAFSKDEPIAILEIDTKEGRVQTIGVPEHHDLHDIANRVLTDLTLTRPDPVDHRSNETTPETQQ